MIRAELVSSTHIVREPASPFAMVIVPVSHGGFCLPNALCLTCNGPAPGVDAEQ